MALVPKSQDSKSTIFFFFNLWGLWRDIDIAVGVGAVYDFGVLRSVFWESH